MTGGAGRLAACALLLCIVALSCLAASEANAARHLCRQLQGELASLGGGGANPARIRKYDAAIIRQSEELSKARSRARRAGCGFSLFGRNVSSCAALNASIDRMNGNLDKLRNERARLARGDTRRERARILSALDKNGCRGTEKAAAKKAKDAAPAGRVLINGVPYSGDGGEEAGLTQGSYLAPLVDLALEKAPRPQGEFRTLCVRTCDGYFFPMSNAATLRDFERDQKNCESSCPGTRMQVFYMRGLDGDTETMTSAATGRPYKDLPTAFLYKKPTPVGAPACGCNAAPGYQVIGGGSRSAGLRSRPQSPSITSFAAAPSPPARKPAEVSRDDGDDAAKPVPLFPDRKVRVVAPAFLPAPEAAIDLQAPARTPAP